MKKQIICAAFFLLMGATYASAVGLTSQVGQPRIARNIISTQLPATLLAGIKDNYKDYWITKCFEEGKKNREGYFITLENADQTVQLKSSDKSSWELVSTAVKE